MTAHIPAADLDNFRGFLQVLRSAGTATSYVSDLTDLERFLGRPAATADTEDLQAWLGDCAGRGLADATISRRAAAARIFFAYLFASELAHTDPAADLRRPRPAPPIPTVLSPAAVARVLAAADGTDPLGLRDRALLELLYGAALRASEATTIEYRHVDPARRAVIVLGKGGRRRVCPFGRDAERALRRYLQHGRRRLLHAPCPMFFLNRTGRPITRQTVWLVVRRYVTAAGIDPAGLGPHTLRHSCATHLLEGGADIRVVQELLGHTRLSTTETYTSISDRYRDTAYFRAHPHAIPRT